jgi:predicted ATPase
VLARDCLGAALALWRGPALAELALESTAALEAERLEDARLVTLEERIEADLALGRDGQLVAELHALVADHPLRERLRAQLMLALYRAGRQAEALDSYRDARRTLVDELGIEPSPQLRELERAILAQDPALRAIARAPQAETWSRCPPLPALLTRLVGREPELEALGELLSHHDVRLVTLTGPGGIGKTRLALAAVERYAGRFADGAAVAMLAGVSDPEVMTLELARALGVGERGIAPLADRLSELLAQRELLVMLDNLEQVVDAVPHLLMRLLSGAPGLKLLATSRTLLRVSAEHVFAVPPLAEADAVSLFVERARALQPGFSLDDANAVDVARICARLEGLPLALELAAARTRLLTPAALLARLDERLPLLTGGAKDAPARHRALSATLDWSYELLDERARQLFARLAVFAGGFTLEAAAATCVGGGAEEGEVLDRLAELADHSLLECRGGLDGHQRFAQLEIVREYARRRLKERGELGVLQRSHAVYFLWLAECADDGLKSPQQEAWLTTLRAEHDNIRAALEWALTAEPELALALCGAMRRFWRISGHLKEAARSIEQALAASPPGPSASRVKAMLALMNVTDDHGEHERSAMLCEQALALAEQIGDKSLLACCWNMRANAAVELGEFELARDGYELCAALAGEVGNAWLLSLASNNLGYLAMTRRDYELATELCEAGLAQAEQLGDRHQMSLTSWNLAVCWLRRGRSHEAMQSARRAAELAREVGDRDTPVLGLHVAAAVLVGDGRLADGGRMLACAEKQLVAAGRTLERAEQELRDETVAAVKALLHDPQVAAAWAEGETMTLEDALTELSGDRAAGGSEGGPVRMGAQPATLPR